jgi:predicted dehydrogenase
MTKRLAVLGLGSMGRKHVKSALALGLDVVGVDPAVSAAPEGVLRMATRADALAWCDAAIVATPSAAHRDDLAAAVAASRHVLVEKPFAASSEGLSAVMDAADAAGVRVAVAQNLRHHPAVEAASAAVRERTVGPVLSAVAIGTSYLPDWRPGQDYRQNYAADPRAGGVIFDWMHEIDMLVHLLGPATVSGAVAAHGRALDIPSEEEAGILLRHTDGALSTLLLSYTTRPALRRTYLLGPGGRMEIDIPARSLLVLSADGRVIEDRAFGGRHEDDYLRELADFLDAVESGHAPRCPGREGLAILETVLAARGLARLPTQE